MTTSLPKKPRAAELGWQLKSSRYLYESHWYNLRQDEIRLPNGADIQFTQIEHPGFVMIVPVTEDGHVILIRSFRYTVDAWSWELPAGGMGNKPGRTALEVAQEELHEETGSVAQNWHFIRKFFTGIGSSDVQAHLFLATGVKLSVSVQNLDPTELIEIHPVPIQEALRMARAGEIADGCTVLALLFCEPLLRDLPEFSVNAKVINP